MAVWVGGGLRLDNNRHNNTAHYTAATPAAPLLAHFLQQQQKLQSEHSIERVNCLSFYCTFFLKKRCDHSQGCAVTAAGS